MKTLTLTEHGKENTISHEKPQKATAIIGKDEVAGSNPAISSMNLEHVASMGPGFFCTLFAVSPGPGHLPIVTQDRGERHSIQAYFRRNTDTVHIVYDEDAGSDPVYVSYMITRYSAKKGNRNDPFRHVQPVSYNDSDEMNIIKRSLSKVERPFLFLPSIPCVWDWMSSEGNILSLF